MNTETTDLSPEAKARFEKAQQRDKHIEHVFRHILHKLEQIVAGITIIALIASLCMQVYDMIFIPGYAADITTFLHHVLTIVVGLEFVRMIIDVTPANVLEVLTLAITRHVILSHDDPLSNIACVACIAGLFAIRRFLIRRTELKEELVENE